MGGLIFEGAYRRLYSTAPEERMVQCLQGMGAHFHIDVKKPNNQVLRICRDGIRHFISAGGDGPIGLFQGRRFEGRLPGQHGVQGTPNGPHLRTDRVTLLQQYFRGNIIRRAADRAETLATCNSPYNKTTTLTIMARWTALTLGPFGLATRALTAHPPNWIQTNVTTRRRIKPAGLIESCTQGTGLLPRSPGRLAERMRAAPTPRGLPPPPHPLWLRHRLR